MAIRSRDHAITVAAVIVAAGVVAKLLELAFGLADPALVFLAGVLFVALRAGLVPSIVASLVSVVVYDFFFVEPRYTFTVTDPQDVLSLTVFLLVAILTSQLAGRVRAQAAFAIERTRMDVVLEEKAKTEAIIEASEDGLIVLDPTSVIVHVNHVACAILEVERDVALDARFDDLASTHPHYLRLREAVRELQTHPKRERDQVEITLFLRGRDHHYVLRPTRFVAREGSPAGLILTLQDITYLRDQERHRENLVATLSHELRTPLTSLRMALELLGRQRTSLAEDQRSLLDTAHDDVLRLQDVSQQFLDIARTRAMAIAVGRGRVDVSALIARVCKLFEIQAQEKRVALETAIARDGELAGDETKLTWALSNLVANALRYTPQGGRVRIESDEKDGAVWLSVSDTGPGIPPERQERIFERFTQYAASDDVGASGLGLSIVRDIVQAHGGRVHLESAPGRGTRFAIELPVG